MSAGFTPEPAKGELGFWVHVSEREMLPRSKTKPS
jgi:hypothetical protein